MDKPTTTLDIYKRFINLKFKSEAADRLRKYLNNIREKTMLENSSSNRFLKIFEAFIVFFSKTVSLKNNHSAIETEDLDKAAYFIEFYSTSKLWAELATGKTFKNLKISESDFLTEIKKIYSLEVSFNAKNAVDRIMERFTLHVNQMFSENENIVKEKFLLLIRYTIIMLSFLISISRDEGRLTVDTVLKGYELFRSILFRIPSFEFDSLFNLKNFIKKEVIMRLLEYMEEAERNRITGEVTEKLVNSLVVRDLTDEKPMFYAELKSAIYVIFLFIHYARGVFRFNDKDSLELLKIYNNIKNGIVEEADVTVDDSFYECLSNIELSIDARIFLNSITNMIISFEAELNIADRMNLIPELARKISHTISLLSKMFSLRYKKTECDVDDLKKGLNIISNVFSKAKQGLLLASKDYSSINNG